MNKLIFQWCKTDVTFIMVSQSDYAAADSYTCVYEGDSHSVIYKRVT